MRDTGFLVKRLQLPLCYWSLVFWKFSDVFDDLRHPSDTKHESLVRGNARFKILEVSARGLNLFVGKAEG